MEGKNGNTRTLVESRKDIEEPRSSNWFEISPDGKRIVVLDPNGAVLVNNIESGTTTILEPGGFLESDLSSAQVVPQWRNSNELLYCGKLPNLKNKLGAEIRLWSAKDNKAISLSQGWSNSATAFLLQYPDEN